VRPEPLGAVGAGGNTSPHFHFGDAPPIVIASLVQASAAIHSAHEYGLQGYSLGAGLRGRFGAQDQLPAPEQPPWFVTGTSHDEVTTAETPS